MCQGVGSFSDGEREKFIYNTERNALKIGIAAGALVALTILVARKDLPVDLVFRNDQGPEKRNDAAPPTAGISVD